MNKKLGLPSAIAVTVGLIVASSCLLSLGTGIGLAGEVYYFIPGTEKHFDADTICIAVGLSPMSTAP